MRPGESTKIIASVVVMGLAFTILLSSFIVRRRRRREDDDWSGESSGRSGVVVVVDGGEAGGDDLGETEDSISAHHVKWLQSDGERNDAPHGGGDDTSNYESENDTDGTSSLEDTGRYPRRGFRSALSEESFEGHRARSSVSLKKDILFTYMDRELISQGNGNNDDDGAGGGVGRS